MQFTTSIENFDLRLGSFMSLEAGQSARVEAEFGALAIELFRLQFDLNLPYRALCEGRGISPDAVNHWKEIPAVPCSVFRDLEITCLPKAERRYEFRSSGTTSRNPLGAERGRGGAASRHFHSARSMRLYEKSVLNGFGNLMETGVVRGKVIPSEMMFLTPPKAEAPHSSLVHMFETIRQEFAPENSSLLGRVGADGAWEIDYEAARNALQAATYVGKPVFLMGTAFLFVHLLDFFGMSGFPLPRRSRVLETGGYKGQSRAMPRRELHSLISQRLNIPIGDIIREYGMCELSSQAYDVGPDGSSGETFYFPPWVRATIVSPETNEELSEGETGLIRIFDLANVFSVAAIQTEDLGIRHGAGFELIGRASVALPRGCSLMSS